MSRYGNEFYKVLGDGKVKCKTLLLLSITLLLSKNAFGQAQAPNSLGAASALSSTDQLYVCQTVGGCDLSGTKPLKQATMSQVATAVQALLVVPSFYVSATGSDANDGLTPTTTTGTGHGPFATLAKCQSAMEASNTVKTCYIRGGAYSMTTMLTLTSADNGETWSYYPPDGYNTAVFDYSGQVFTFPTNVTAILIQGGNNITINGFEFRNLAGGGIAIHGGVQAFDLPWNSFGSVYATTGAANGNTIINNIIHDSNTLNFNTSPAGWDVFLTAIQCTGTVQNTTISNNAIWNFTSVGIACNDLENQGDTNNGGTPFGLSNLTITNNFVQNTSEVVGGVQAPDGAGIYMNNRQPANGTTNPSGRSLNITVQNNYIRDVGFEESGTFGIYLDDGTSNATVTHNIVAGQMQQGGLFHCGANNIVQNNIIDLGYGTYGFGPQGNWSNAHNCSSPTMTNMAGNSFTGNILIANNSTTAFGYGYSGVGTNSFTQPTVANNFYHNYGSGSIKTTGTADMNGDSNPVTTGDPLISGLTYTVAWSSPVFQSPVSWVRNPTNNWGPPGFVIPLAGTAPSSPH